MNALEKLPLLVSLIPKNIHNVYMYIRYTIYTKKSYFCEILGFSEKNS